MVTLIPYHLAEMRLPRLEGALIITHQVLHRIGRHMVGDTTIEIDTILTGSVHRLRIVAAIITIAQDTRRTPTATDAGLRQTIDTRIAVMVATIGSRQIITGVAIRTGGVTTIVIAIAMVGTTQNGEAADIGEIHGGIVTMRMIVLLCPQILPLSPLHQSCQLLFLPRNQSWKYHRLFQQRAMIDTRAWSLALHSS